VKRKEGRKEKKKGKGIPSFLGKKKQEKRVLSFHSTGQKGKRERGRGGGGGSIAFFVSFAEGGRRTASHCLAPLPLEGGGGKRGGSGGKEREKRGGRVYPV